MHRIQFIHPPPENPALRRRVVLASCLFHGVMLCLLLVLTAYYRSHLPPPSGSAIGTPTMSLQPMVIVSTPAEPPPPSELIPPPVPMPPTPTEAEVPLHNPIAPAKIPEMGVPVLPVSPAKAIAAKTEISHHPSVTHSTSQTSAKASSSAVVSSYSPGANALPHPPYPDEARSRGQTGTVVMYVQFDAEGNVARADISQSSGVPLLDTETRLFIREHWHSAEFAGQSINQPVQYSLQNL